MMINSHFFNTTLHYTTLKAIGDSGIDQSVEFKAAVCTLPAKSTRRSLESTTFQWKGGGGCRGCPCDCYDGRRDLQNVIWGTTDWFNMVYAPQLESSILDAIVNTVVSKHSNCLGVMPIMAVGVNKITLKALKSRFQCRAGKFMSLLETLPISDTIVIDRMCNTCVSIDFSTASDGTSLFGGMNISQQWQPDGLTIDATSTLPLKTNARILDTGNEMCILAAKAQEYGSPNQSCPGGGIGVGSGGTVGKEGENCAALGSTLSSFTFHILSTQSSYF
jgi:hypothetical protein